MNPTFRTPDPADQRSYDDFVAQRNWSDALRLLDEHIEVEHSLQLRFLLAYGEQIPEDEYWLLLWVAYKRAFQGIDRLTTSELRSLFRMKPNSRRLMSGDDFTLSEDLPTDLVIYRGYHDVERALRFSWTLSEGQAARFALLFHRKSERPVPMISRARVSKDHILACFAHELEVLVDPDLVKVEESYTVPEELWVEAGYKKEFAELQLRQKNR